MAVKRILEQWEPLRLYFNSIFLEERLGAVDNIHAVLNDPSIFLYLNFLDYILPYLNTFNLIFQSKGPPLHLLHNKIQDVYISLLGIFYHPGSITRSRLHLIDPQNKSQNVPINQIYLGATLHKLFNKQEYQGGNMINEI